MTKKETQIPQAEEWFTVLAIILSLMLDLKLLISENPEFIVYVRIVAAGLLVLQRYLDFNPPQHFFDEEEDIEPTIATSPENNIDVELQNDKKQFILENLNTLLFPLLALKNLPTVAMAAIRNLFLWSRL